MLPMAIHWILSQHGTSSTLAVEPGDIAEVRRFNRFHTRLVGALNEHLLASSYSLPQMRVLYEIATAAPDAAPSARELGDVLRVDTAISAGSSPGWKARTCWSAGPARPMPSGWNCD